MTGVRLGLTMVVAAVLMACVGSASACGCGVMLQASEVYEKALVTYHDGIETIVPGLAIADAGPHAAVVFPVPRPPKLRALPADVDVFGELEAATTPKPTESPGLGGASGASAPATPRVIARRLIGGYEVTILRGGTGATLFAWLTAHGYHLPAGATPILMTYAAGQWYFVAIRLAHQATGEIKPLAIAFRSPRIVYPMRLSSVAIRPFALELFVNADEPVRAIGVPDLVPVFAGTVGSLNPAPSHEVLSLLPARYLTLLEANAVVPASVNSDVFTAFVSPGSIPSGPLGPLPPGKSAGSGGSSPWPYIAIGLAVLAAAGLGLRWFGSRRDVNSA